MSIRSELLTATDEVIEDAVQYMDPMALRGLLYQLTGDEEVAKMELKSDMFLHLVIHGLANESDAALLRLKAAAFLKGYRDQGAGEIDLGPPERLFRSFALAAGEEVPVEERDMWLEQSTLDPWARGIKWKGVAPPAEQRQAFTVGVIGAGLSGLNCAVHLKRAGIPFTVFEKNPEVGGTWYENSYPGARVDTPSRTYTHKFGAHFTYPYNYCPQEENLRYLKWVADNYGVREEILFNTEIQSAKWDDGTQTWIVTANPSSGSRSFRFNAIICCVGFLSRPQMPQIRGMEAFTGVACHTAKWPRDLDLTGKRVAVIGTGASGYQTAPVIAKIAAQTYVFQRTPSWCMPTGTYLSTLPPQVTWLERNFPYFVAFERFRQAWLYGPKPVFESTSIDPNYKDPHARSAVNKLLRDHCVAYIRKMLASRPELVDKMIPEAPPLSSRPITIDEHDNIYGALLRDNVTLVTDGIEQITPTGIKAGGEEIPLDVIVYATGFRAQDFLWPMEVLGRDGIRAEEAWKKDGARAYLGAMIPGFPNFFMIYGPNSNNWGGLRAVDLLELVGKFALECIAGLIVQRKRSVEVTTDAYWRFADELDRSEAKMIYKDPRAQNYYTNSYGRSAVNGPIDIRRMWRWLRDPSGPSPRETDADIRPYFGEDLVVKA
jgi:4-hydroxyacetophenone monooxygenase